MGGLQLRFRRRFPRYPITGHVSAPAVGAHGRYAGYSNSDFAYIGFGISQESHIRQTEPEQKPPTGDAAVTERIRSAEAQRFRAGESQLLPAWYIQKTLGVLERDQTLLDQIERIADARIAWGQGQSAGRAKAQLQKTKS